MYLSQENPLAEEVRRLERVRLTGTSHGPAWTLDGRAMDPTRTMISATTPAFRSGHTDDRRVGRGVAPVRPYRDQRPQAIKPGTFWDDVFIVCMRFNEPGGAGVRGTMAQNRIR